MDEKKLFLLDAYALIYRAYYALIRAPRVTSKGLNTSAIFGFCNTLDEVLRKEDPQYIAVCFDPAGPTFRHKVYPEYKAQREKQPEDISVAVPYIKRILQAYRICTIEMPGYEADDVIGTLAHKASGEGYTTYMMTPDKDYGQLVTDNVYMYRPALKGNGFEIRGPKEVCEKYGIQNTKQVIDLLALEGDASDNVPGCPGVGEKTAAKLINEFGSVENLLDHTDRLKGAMQKKVTENAEQIRFSKFLVTIKTDVPIEVDLADLRRKEPDIEMLSDIYEELEFKTFLARLSEKSMFADKSDNSSKFYNSDSSHPSDFSDVPSEAPLTLADTPALVAEKAAEAAKSGIVGLSITAFGDENMTAAIHGIALAYGKDSNVYIPLAPKGFGREETMAMLQPLFSDPKVKVVTHDVKRDMILLRRENVEMLCPYFDTSIAHYLLKPEMSHSLDFVAFDVAGFKTSTYALSDLERKKLAKQPTSDTERQSAERARTVLRIKPIMEKLLEEQGQTSLMQDIELPFAAVLASMEWEGVRVDVPELNRLSTKLSQRLIELEDKVYALAGSKFNISSPSQVGEILFGRMEIDPKAKKTKKGAWSTTEEILEKYRKDYEIVDMILKVRALRKLLTTYVDALPKLINPVDGKIHTQYNQTVTATGRISSTNPNLQNIPIRTDDGREIRRTFIPDPGDLLLSADYSQIELRLMADFSGDPAMLEAFNSGKDIHRATAAKIYHIPLEEVTDNQRRNAKTANFGIIYGISAFGLSQRLDIPRGEAKMLIDGYLSTYPDVQKYMDDSIAHAREKGYVSTIMGRKRYLPDINSRNATVRGYAERNAINAPLQGSAADIIKIAMIRIHDAIRHRGMRSRMIMQVHDELVFNVKPDEAAELMEIVVREMEEAYHGKVHLDVSAGIGANWLEAH